jgi:hypothetical protein
MLRFVAIVVRGQESWTELGQYRARALYSMDGAQKVLDATRGTIAMLLYLNRLALPNVNGKLAAIANNIYA